MTELSQIGKDGLGCCVENSQRLILWDQMFHDWTYHEGIVWNNRLKVKMIHAWLESGEYVVDSAQGTANFLPREMYYEIGQIENVRKFDRARIEENVQRTGNWEFVELTEEDIWENG